MKQDIKILTFGAIINFFISIIKLIGGILFNFNTLIADSLYTFCDFITDIMGICGAKLSSKRPTKYHPFGYGRVEYLTNLFMGLFLILVGAYIFAHSFSIKPAIPSLYVLIFLLVSIILKLLIIVKQLKIFKKTKSSVVLSSIHEAKIDLISASCVSVIVILMQFSNKIDIFKYGDIFGSMILSFMIFKISFELIRNNVLHLLGEVELDKEKIDLVKEEISKTKNIVSIKKIELIKYGGYYKAHLILIMDPNMTIKMAKKLELDITSHLKKMKKLKIKFVNIDLDI